MKRPEICYCLFCNGTILPVDRDACCDENGNWYCGICRDGLSARLGPSSPPCYHCGRSSTMSAEGPGGEVLPLCSACGNGYVGHMPWVTSLQTHGYVPWSRDVVLRESCPLGGRCCDGHGDVCEHARQCDGCGTGICVRLDLCRRLCDDCWTKGER
jgi:hypothetical protein